MSEPPRVMVASIGWTGHAFPALALARELRRRGHEVTVETLRALARGRRGARAALRRRAASRSRFGEPGDAGRRPTWPRPRASWRRRSRNCAPTSSSATCSTLAPALAAELAGVPRATLIPHPYPVREPGLPLYPLGLLPPRTPLGRAGLAGGLAAGRTAAAEHAAGAGSRAELDARPRPSSGWRRWAATTGRSASELALVATFPQLEYPRRWPRAARGTGPLPFELPHPEVELPPRRRAAGARRLEHRARPRAEADPRRRSRRSRTSRCG